MKSSDTADPSDIGAWLPGDVPDLCDELHRTEWLGHLDDWNPAISVELIELPQTAMVAWQSANDGCRLVQVSRFLAVGRY